MHLSVGYFRALTLDKKGKSARLPELCGRTVWQLQEWLEE